MFMFDLKLVGGSALLARSSDLGLCHLDICLSRLGLQIVFLCLNPQSTSPRDGFFFFLLFWW